jgi:hypothetical protein
MRRLASFVGFILLATAVSLTSHAVEESTFGVVSRNMSSDASSVGFDISGKFEKGGGTVDVAEIPSYVDPQQGLLVMVNVIAKAGDQLIEQCKVGEDYPISVVVNGVTSHTTAGRCKAFRKNPTTEAIGEFWAAPNAS